MVGSASVPSMSSVSRVTLRRRELSGVVGYAGLSTSVLVGGWPARDNYRFSRKARRLSPQTTVEIVRKPGDAGQFNTARTTGTLPSARSTALHLPAGRITVSGRLVVEPDGTVTIEPRQRHDQLTTSGTGPIEPRSQIHLGLTGIDTTELTDLPGARRDDARAQAWADLVAVVTSDGMAHVERCTPLTSLTDFWTPGPSVVLDADIPTAPAGLPPDPSPLPLAERQK
jgi:hypothetical protein